MFIALTLLYHSIMEAFILEERVLTAQHMARIDHNDLKYLKKYDLPDQHSHTHNKQHEHVQRK